MATIHCVPLDGFPEEVLMELAVAIGEVFRHPIQILDGFDTNFLTYDPARGQHDSTAILQILRNRTLPPGDKILGLTTADLFIPIFTFIFGEAQLNGEAAVVSGRRLQNEFYGMIPNAAVYSDRLYKECIHELGHTFGLRHCLSVGCAMQKSTYVEDIDLKTSDFCSACRDFLHENDTLLKDNTAK